MTKNDATEKAIGIGFSREKFRANRLDYILFFIFHVVFSCAIFSIHETVVFVEVVGILLVAPIFSFINVEFFRKQNFDYFVYMAIFKVLLVAFVYLQYHVNEWLLRLWFLATAVGQ